MAISPLFANQPNIQTALAAMRQQLTAAPRQPAWKTLAEAGLGGTGSAAGNRAAAAALPAAQPMPMPIERYGGGNLDVAFPAPEQIDGQVGIQAEMAPNMLNPGGATTLTPDILRNLPMDYLSAVDPGWRSAVDPIPPGGPNDVAVARELPTRVVPPQPAGAPAAAGPGLPAAKPVAQAAPPQPVAEAPTAPQALKPGRAPAPMTAPAQTALQRSRDARNTLRAQVRKATGRG